MLLKIMDKIDPLLEKMDISTENRNRVKGVLAIAMLFGPIIAVAFLSYNYFLLYTEYDEFLPTLFSALLFGNIWVVLLCLNPKVRKINKMALQVKFYEECVSKGITNVNGSYEKQKAELIAKELKCKYSDISVYFREAKTAAQESARDQSAALQKEEISKQRDKEKKKCREMTRFAEQRGRDKRVAILQYMQESYRKEAKRIREGAHFVLRASQEKEENWGVIGGIVSGVAGGAAGVAAAVDSQLRNEEIRARNKANLKVLAPGILGVMESAGQYEDEAENLQVSIDDAKLKLVSDLSDEKVFSLLSVVNPQVSISRTGNFTVSASVKVTAKKQEMMFGKVPGVIDGTIAADLYQDGKRVGTALMVLPTFGISKQETVEGMCIARADRKKKYTVKFRPHKLWLMEE